VQPLTSKMRREDASPSKSLNIKYSQKQKLII
jgi:hypothetical protein